MRVIFYVLMMLVAGTAYGQEVDVEVSVTGRNSAYWLVMVDGSQVSQHTLEREAVESAVNHALAIPDAEVTIVHNVVYDVEASIVFDNVAQPDPTPDPVPEPIVQIPGSASWVPVDFGVVKRFAVLNDNWAVVSDNKWLYMFKVGPVADNVYLVNRPAGWYRNNYVLSETTPLTDEQLVDLVTAIVENEDGV